MKKSLKKILGVKVNIGMTRSEFMHTFNHFMSLNTSTIIATVNPEFVLSSIKDTEFREILNKDCFCIPDGVGILLASIYIENMKKTRSKFLSFVQTMKSIFCGNLSEYRITGADLIYDICQYAEKHDKSVYLLGGMLVGPFGNPIKDRDLALEASEVLKKKFPKLNIVGATSAFTRGPADDEDTINYIQKNMKDKNINSIDILFVSYGGGFQEKWLKRNQKCLNYKVGIGVGGTFSFVVNNYLRAPLFIQKLNLEWVYRLLTQPFRIKRIVNAFLVFPYKVFKFHSR